MKSKFSQLFLVLLFTYIQVQAQELPITGMFRRVQFFYNPACAGAGEGVHATVLYRQQWRNVSGAPSTQIFLLDSPLGRNIGGGLVLARDQMGSLVRYDLMANASYRIYVNPESYFQAGLRVGTSLVTMGENLFQWDENDPLNENRNSKGAIPRIGTGLYYRSPAFYAGISSPDLVSIDARKLYADNSGKSMIRSNYVALAGAKANISEYLAFVPSAIILYYPTRPVVASVNAGIEFNQTLLATMGYRTPNIIFLRAMVGITTKLKIGYLHEISTNPTGIGKFSTTEFMLSYGLN